MDNKDYVVRTLNASGGSSIADPSVGVEPEVRKELAEMLSLDFGHPRNLHLGFGSETGQGCKWGTMDYPYEPP